jgi:hypothetical protein
MTIINEVQKTIFDCLSKQDGKNFLILNGIFTYIEKNSNFPYIFISINKAEDLSTFSKSIHSYLIGINVFDKNTTNSFITNISDDIKLLFSNISNFISINYEILDIKFKQITTLLESNNTIWKNEILFEFIISSSITNLTKY